MKDFVKLLILGGALSVMASPAVAKNVYLHCDQPKCTYKEEMDGGATLNYVGNCVGDNNPDNYSLACHPVKGMTCLGGTEDPNSSDWNCSCTNWATHRQTVTIDLLCTN